MNETKKTTEYDSKESGCCGGPAAPGLAACCVMDAEAKAEGKSGCGCGESEDQSTRKESGCCSSTDSAPGALKTDELNGEMNMATHDKIRSAVRHHYGEVAGAGNTGCGGEGYGCGPSCCGTTSSSIESLSQELGYNDEDISSVPKGANMGLGCGNPQAIAALKLGETVLDLGSGGGFDCFLAARQIGDTGRVIGVDMTPEMVSKARSNAKKGNYLNVEFRLGEIENLPLADMTVDVIISNCVINLSPDKPRVFREAFRVLKPGGRLAVSDVVSFVELPDKIREDLSLYTGCIAGAATVSEVKAMLRESGFKDIRVSPKGSSRSFIRDWVPGTDISEYVLSANIEAVKTTN